MIHSYLIYVTFIMQNEYFLVNRLNFLQLESLFSFFCSKMKLWAYLPFFLWNLNFVIMTYWSSLDTHILCNWKYYNSTHLSLKLCIITFHMVWTYASMNMNHDWNSCYLLAQAMNASRNKIMCQRGKILWGHYGKRVNVGQCVTWAKVPCPKKVGATSWSHGSFL